MVPAMDFVLRLRNPRIIQSLLSALFRQPAVIEHVQDGLWW